MSAVLIAALAACAFGLLASVLVSRASSVPAAVNILIGIAVVLALAAVAVLVLFFLSRRLASN
jgi:hypothetical protein